MRPWEAAMKPRSLFLLAFLTLFGCSGNDGNMPDSQHQLLSITLSPMAAAAAASGGQVQFVATGHYGTAPLTVSPIQANWGTFSKHIGITNQNGLASCVASGATTIEVWVLLQNGGPVCNVIDPAGMPCGTINARAQFTCS
jgi:hypothetical protein